MHEFVISLGLRLNGCENRLKARRDRQAHVAVGYIRVVGVLVGYDRICSVWKSPTRVFLVAYLYGYNRRRNNMHNALLMDTTLPQQQSRILACHATGRTQYEHNFKF